MKAKLHPQSAQFRAIEELQILRSKHPPGSRQHEIADKAIDLALNESRSDDEYLTRNAYRDARRTLDRQAKKYTFFSIEAANDDAIDGKLPDDFIGYLSDPASPESELFAEQINQHILRSSLGPTSTIARVFQGMVDGRTAKQTASELSVGPSRVAQYRSKIRNCTRQLLPVKAVSNA